MKFKITILFSFLFCAAKMVAAQKKQVLFTVIDSLSKAPVDNANIGIVNTNGNELFIDKTNKNGIANINIHLSNTPTLLVVSSLGYQKKYMPVSANSESILDLGTIFLVTEKVSLTNVVVKGIKQPMGYKIDRQVYKTSQYSSATNGSAVDVIKNLPAISVNATGDILFRGSSSFLVLVNGKPTQGDVSFVLSQIPANLIESVEVITNPSSNFDADGKSGIINIVTKQAVQDGIMLQANTMYGLPPFNNFNNQHYNHPQRFAADVMFSYKKKKLDFSVGINYLRNDIAGYREGEVYTIINNVKTSFPSEGERSFKRYNDGFRTSISFQANEKNSISAGFYYGKKFQSRVADIVYNNIKINLLNNNTISSYNYFNANTQDKEGAFSLASLDYARTINVKSKITLSILYEFASLSGTTYNANFKSISSTDTLQFTKNPYNNPLNAIRAKADYSINLPKGKLQIGYQIKLDKQDGDFIYLTKTVGSENYIIDPLFTSKVSVNNIINAAYTQYDFSISQLKIAAGLRLENQDRNLVFSLNNENKKLNFLNLFPSFQARYPLASKLTAKLGYSRRIKRTNNYELNPFPEREHSETLEQGDPELSPELIGVYECGIEKTLSKGSFFATIYYQTTNNPIQRVNKVYNDTILNRIYTNATKAYQFGLETSINYKVTNFFSTTLSANLYQYHISGAIFHNSTNINSSSFIYSINAIETFSIKKNWVIQLTANYLSLRATAQGEDGYFFTPHLSVKKVSENKKWSFQVQWLNMDAGLKISNKQRITTWDSNFYTTTNYIYEPDQIQFSIGYNLLKKNRKVALPVSEIGEKEF